MGVWLALVAALSYGVGDFVGGVGGRRTEPALIPIGMVMFRKDSRTQAHDLGRVFIGLGLMLLALHQLLGIMTVYENSPILSMVLSAVSASWLLDVCLAAVVTWAAHSSVAIVLLTMSLATKGVIPADAAFALVLGANLGTAINPLVEWLQHRGLHRRGAAVAAAFAAVLGGVILLAATFIQACRPAK